MSVAVDEETFWLGDWKVEPTLNRIVRGEEIVRIDPRNMKVLQLLASKPGEVFSQAEIEESVWSDVIVTPNSVYQSIAQLRRALGDEKDNPKYIETIARKGYRLVAHLGLIREPLTSREPQARTLRNFAHSIWRNPTRLTFVSFVSVLCAIYALGGTRMIGSSRMSMFTPTFGGGDHSDFMDLGELPEAANIRPVVLHRLGLVALAQGKPQAARYYLERALLLEQKHANGRKGNTTYVLVPLSRAYLWQSNYAAAESAARAALSDVDDMPVLHPERITAMENLGYVLLEAGNYSDAEDYIVEALNHTKHVYGEHSWVQADLCLRLGLLRYSQGHLSESEGIARNVLRLQEQLGTDDLTKGYTKTLIASILLAQHRYEEARQEAEATIRMFDGLRHDHQYLISARDLLAKSLIGLRAYTEAETLLRENIRLWQRNDGWNKHASWSASALGEALLGQGRISEADQYLSQASLDIDESHPGRQEQDRFREHSARIKKLQLAKATLTRSVAPEPQASTHRID